MDNNILRISTQTGDLFEDWSEDYDYLYKELSFIRQCGFDAIDYNMDHFTHIEGFWDKSIKELYEHFSAIRNAAADAGIVFTQAHAAFPLYVHNNDTANAYLEEVIFKTIAVCSYIGCKNVVMHPFTFPSSKEKEIEINFNLYRKMIPAAKEYNVKICLENMFCRFNGKPYEGACATSEESCMYIDTLNREAGGELFGYCLDIGHANLLGKNLRNFIVALSSRLTCLHIHDNDSISDLHAIPYTQVRSSGNFYCTDWDGMIQGLKEIGYKGDLSFETFRGINLIPQEAREHGLKLISAIGESFRSRILDK